MKFHFNTSDKKPNCSKVEWHINIFLQIPCLLYWKWVSYTWHQANRHFRLPLGHFRWEKTMKRSSGSATIKRDKTCTGITILMIHVEYYMSPVKRICVFEHSVMTNFNCACPAIQRARDLAFCLKVPLDSLFVWASSEGSGETARMRRLAWTFPSA